MIKVVDSEQDIINLWQEAFGDTTEDIKFFIDNLSHGKCLGYYENEKLVSMMYIVDCNYKCFSSEYLYAVCTLKAYRGKGIMSKLLDYCKENCKYSLCLIPANEKLIDYYKKRDICKEISINDISFDETEEIVEYLFEGCELEKPFALMFSKGDN